MSRASARVGAGCRRVLVADQTPITDAPRDAYRSEFFAPSWNMKNATVAKNSG